MIPLKKRGKDSPITDEEILRIKELQATNTIAEISRVLRRPVGTVARIAKAKMLGPQPKQKNNFFDWKDYNYSII